MMKRLTLAIAAICGVGFVVTYGLDKLVDAVERELGFAPARR